MRQKQLTPFRDLDEICVSQKKVHGNFISRVKHCQLVMVTRSAITHETANYL